MLGLAQIALATAGYSWPAWHVAKRWGPWALVALWINCSVLVALAAMQWVDAPLLLSVVDTNNVTVPSFWRLLPMPMLALGGPSLVVYWRLRKGDMRYTPVTALASGIAMILGVVAFFIIMIPSADFAWGIAVGK